LFEHEAQPDKFDNIPNSIYWAVITLASVGYGDISPVTPAGRAMTIVVALLGIGIFAIPAALMTTAFNDELLKQRQALKNKIHDILLDGVIDPEEMAFIRTESKRLHFDVAEINALIQQVQKELEDKTNFSAMPIHTIAGNPEHAVEHFKSLLSTIRQLTLLTDPVMFEKIAVAKDRLSASELALWQQIQARS
jgi:hypothetical protein